MLVIIIHVRYFAAVTYYTVLVSGLRQILYATELFVTFYEDDPLVSFCDLTPLYERFTI
jgi:hypothetical protein